MKRPFALLLAFLFAGCAQGQPGRLYLADNAAYLCKHCNCYMPAGTDLDAQCSVCDCKKVAHTCIRGR